MNDEICASTGDYSQAASAGYRSKAASTGYYSIAMVAGVDGRVAAGERGAFALAYLDTDGRIRIAVGYPGEDGIQPGRWYRADRFGALIDDGPVEEAAGNTQDKGGDR